MVNGCSVEAMKRGKIVVTKHYEGETILAFVSSAKTNGRQDVISLILTKTNERI